MGARDLERNDVRATSGALLDARCKTGTRVMQVGDALLLGTGRDIDANVESALAAENLADETDARRSRLRRFEPNRNFRLVGCPLFRRQFLESFCVERPLAAFGFPRFGLASPRQDDPLGDQRERFAQDSSCAIERRLIVSFRFHRFAQSDPLSGDRKRSAAGPQRRGSDQNHPHRKC